MAKSDPKVGEWVFPKELNPEPASEYWCAIRFRYARFDYETMKSIEIYENVIEDFLSTNEYGVFEHPTITQLDLMVYNGEESDIARNLIFDYYKFFEKPTYSDGIYHAQGIEIQTKKRKYIHDYEIEVLAYYEIPPNYVEWIARRVEKNEI